MRDVNDTTAELQGSVQQIKLIQAIGPVFLKPAITAGPVIIRRSEIMANEVTVSEEDEAAKAELEELRAFKAGIEAEQAEAAKVARTEARTADIKEILGEDVEEETLEAVVAKVIDLDDEAYAEKVEEWRIIAAKARPEVMLDGGQGSPDEEGATGESKAKSGPRENVKISASLEDAEIVVEEHIELTEEIQEAKPLGLANILFKKNKE